LAGLGPASRLWWTASFAFATVALPYVEHVNGHIQFLAALATVLLVVVGLPPLAASQRAPVARLACLGSLTGLAYSLEIGSGFTLLLCLLPLVIVRCPRPGGLAIFALGLAPWLAAAHGLNYFLGGFFRPLNMVPDYLVFVGSAFGPEDMTGLWNHPGV